MALKEQLFALFLILIIFFPFFFSKKEIKVDKQINLPNIIVINGKFKEFNNTLEKKGTFSHLDYFNENYYISTNVHIKFLDKNGTFCAKKVIIKNHIMNANKIHYTIKGLK